MKGMECQIQRNSRRPHAPCSKSTCVGIFRRLQELQASASRKPKQRWLAHANVWWRFRLGDQNGLFSSYMGIGKVLLYFAFPWHANWDRPSHFTRSNRISL